MSDKKGNTPKFGIGLGDPKVTGIGLGDLSPNASGSPFSIGLGDLAPNASGTFSDTGLSSMQLSDLYKPTDDPIKQSTGAFDQDLFYKSAMQYFSAKPGTAPDNLTLRMFDSAFRAYFQVGPMPVELKAAVSVLSGVEERFSGVSSRAIHAENLLAELGGKLVEFQNEVGNPAAALEGFKASLAESLKLQEARKLWRAAAERAGRAYVGSWCVLFVLLIAIPAIAIWQSDAIFTFFRAVGGAVLVDLPTNASETAILIAAVSRLVLITLPVALYIWLVRIVVRFNMRSLLLMDDANQRNTMLETYLHLVEQDASVKADRPLILEALFRRTPGHGPDTIEPPNLADILKIGVPQSPR